MSDVKENTPQCVGMIMDGNRRWAKKRLLPTMKGHHKGYEKLQEVQEWCKEKQIGHLVVYAFSTENWNRSQEEVDYLMDLMRKLIQEWLPKLHENNTAMHVAGDLARFPEDIQQSIHSLHEANPKDATFHLWVAASYGGRSEIVAAANTLLEKGVMQVNEESFSEALWTKGMPDPEIIIRTGGQQRLSNFLLWHAAYSELWFTDTLWPDFSKKDFEVALTDLAVRQRNFGA